MWRCLKVTCDTPEVSARGTIPEYGRAAARKQSSPYSFWVESRLSKNWQSRTIENENGGTMAAVLMLEKSVFYLDCFLLAAAHSYCTSQTSAEERQRYRFRNVSSRIETRRVTCLDSTWREQSGNVTRTVCVN